MAGRIATIIIPIAWKAVDHIDWDGNQGAIKNCPIFQLLSYQKRSFRTAYALKGMILCTY
jgi:hypothetical protein